jgi:hypothetical protein
MKTDSKSLCNEFASLAPGLALNTTWEPDPYFSWNGDGPDPRENGYSPYDVKVTATIISNGLMFENSADLGGCYAQPGEFCPEVHGYWNQMAEEAISELPDFPGKAAALSLLHTARQIDYDRQRTSE